MREIFWGRLIAARITEKTMKTRGPASLNAEARARNALKLWMNWNAACSKCASSPAST